jgi:hypothetical protein
VVLADLKKTEPAAPPITLNPHHPTGQAGGKALMQTAFSEKHARRPGF